MPVFVYSPDQVLVLGLKIAGYKPRQINRVQRKTNIERFKDSFGVAPIVYAQIWQDLQTTNIAEARIDTTKPSCTIITFLQAIRFLKKYDTEKDRGGQTGKCDKFCRYWGWYFLDRVAALRGAKVLSTACWLLFCMQTSLLSSHLSFLHLCR